MYYMNYATYRLLWNHLDMVKPAVMCWTVDEKELPLNTILHGYYEDGRNWINMITPTGWVILDRCNDAVDWRSKESDMSVVEKDAAIARIENLAVELQIIQLDVNLATMQGDATEEMKALAFSLLTQQLQNVLAKDRHPKLTPWIDKNYDTVHEVLGKWVETHPIESPSYRNVVFDPAPHMVGLLNGIDDQTHQVSGYLLRYYRECESIDADEQFLRVVIYNGTRADIETRIPYSLLREIGFERPEVE
jgi:hypothetical protein